MTVRAIKHMFSISTLSRNFKMCFIEHNFQNNLPFIRNTRVNIWHTVAVREMRQRVKLDHTIVEILKKLYETLRKVSPIHEMMSRRGKKRATWKRRFFWNIARPRKGERRPCYINVNIEAKICSRHDKHDGEYKMDKAFDRCEYRLSVLDYETIFASR